MILSYAIGLGAAADLCREEMSYDTEHVTRLSERLIEGICSQLPAVVRNGDSVMNYPGCVNLSFSCIEGTQIDR